MRSQPRGELYRLEQATVQVTIQVILHHLFLEMVARAGWTGLLQVSHLVLALHPSQLHLLAAGIAAATAQKDHRFPLC
jgi:hypothetical protein